MSHQSNNRNISTSILNILGINKKENTEIHREVTKTINKNNNNEDSTITAMECHNMSTFLIIDIIIIFVIIRHIRIFIINPYIYHIYSSDYQLLSKTLYKYYLKYTQSNELQKITFYCYLVLIVLFLSLDSYQFQNIGILLFMSFITFITAEANQMLSGALFSCIVTYLFLRIKASLKNKNKIIAKCSFPLVDLCKKIIMAIFCLFKKSNPFFYI